MREQCLAFLRSSKSSAVVLQCAARDTEPLLRRSTLSSVLGPAGLRRLHEALGSDGVAERMAATELLCDLARDEGNGLLLLFRQAGFLMQATNGSSVWVFSVPRKMFLAGSGAAGEAAARQSAGRGESQSLSQDMFVEQMHDRVEQGGGLHIADGIATFPAFRAHDEHAPCADPAKHLLGIVLSADSARRARLLGVVYRVQQAEPGNWSDAECPIEALLSSQAFQADWPHESVDRLRTIALKASGIISWEQLCKCDRWLCWSRNAGMEKAKSVLLHRCRMQLPAGSGSLPCEVSFTLELFPGVTAAKLHIQATSIANATGPETEPFVASDAPSYDFEAVLDAPRSAAALLAMAEQELHALWQDLRISIAPSGAHDGGEVEGAVLQPVSPPAGVQLQITLPASARDILAAHSARARALCDCVRGNIFVGMRVHAEASGPPASGGEVIGFVDSLCAQHGKVPDGAEACTAAVRWDNTEETSLCAVGAVAKQRAARHDFSFGATADSGGCVQQLRFDLTTSSGHEQVTAPGCFDGHAREAHALCEKAATLLRGAISKAINLCNAVLQGKCDDIDALAWRAAVQSGLALKRWQLWRCCLLKASAKSKLLRSPDKKVGVLLSAVGSVLAQQTDESDRRINKEDELAAERALAQIRVPHNLLLRKLRRKHQQQVRRVDVARETRRNDKPPSGAAATKAFDFFRFNQERLINHKRHVSAEARQAQIVQRIASSERHFDEVRRHEHELVKKQR